MSQFTVQLPKTLYQQLMQLAEGEGISLNQYIIYALTRQVTLSYSIQTASEAEIAHQKQSFTALLEDLKQASPEQLEAVLAEREQVEPEAELDSEIIERLQQRIHDRSKI